MAESVSVHGEAHFPLFEGQMTPFSKPKDSENVVFWKILITKVSITTIGEK